MEIRTIGVVGAGTMGHGIAQVAAQSGYEVILVDAVPEALERGRAQIGKGLERLVGKGKLSAEERDGALGGVSRRTGTLAALARADLVVEAVVERLEVKQQVLAELDRICASGRHPRHQHQLDLDHQARRRHRAAARR